MSERTPATPERGTDDLLAERYQSDHLFRTVVDAVSDGGFADEDGNLYSGPTVADAERADQVLAALLAHLSEHGALLDGEGRVVKPIGKHCLVPFDPMETT